MNKFFHIRSSICAQMQLKPVFVKPIDLQAANVPLSY
eukprot:CAMPEP_0195273906 /NCGR_PEP_ID=MMETSP0706-20130129/16814_1 /TAXON_ID=33640 /ORGANISM="Asterionellopsis glacialis, Strain CCMP134" /LENGTH=36 /DNA_ID= /DNA_START= /DNA_END= /DNA_ORIENTATION=